MTLGKHVVNISTGLTAMVMIAGTAVPAQAHGGGLDGLGCHHNRKAGGYHCHRGRLADQHFHSKSEAQIKLKSSQRAPN